MCDIKQEPVECKPEMVLFPEQEISGDEYAEDTVRNPGIKVIYNVEK